jgi:hypothetical protein
MTELSRELEKKERIDISPLIGCRGNLAGANATRTLAALALFGFMTFFSLAYNIVDIIPFSLSSIARLFSAIKSRRTFFFSPI